MKWRSRAAMRAEGLDVLRSAAAGLFAKRPYRSLLVSVGHFAEYGFLGVHTHVVASSRDVPLWPHVCRHAEPHYSLELAGGEGCPACDLDVPEIAIGDDDELEAFCHDHGDEALDAVERFLPYAIARRHGDVIAIELVGTLRRPAADLVTGRTDRSAWPDPRARALFELVCAHPGDDAPRRVLGDYLLELADPRGELIALSLAEHQTATSRARLDELIEEYGHDWIHPLGAVIPATGAHFERGFLARAEVWAPDARAIATVRGADAWRTVESLWMLRGSADVIDPAMTSLREAGPISTAGIFALAATPQRNLESLHVVLDDDDGVDALIGATTLPRLRRLTICGGHYPSALVALPRALWFPSLENVTVLGRPGATEGWQDIEHHAGALPSFSIAHTADTGHPGGWQVTFSREVIEITIAGWHYAFTSYPALEQLVERLAGDARPIVFVPSRWWTPTAQDLERILRVTGRAVRLRS